MCARKEHRSSILHSKTLRQYYFFIKAHYIVDMKYPRRSLKSPDKKLGNVFMHR